MKLSRYRWLTLLALIAVGLAGLLPSAPAWAQDAPAGEQPQPAFRRAAPRQDAGGLWYMESMDAEAGAAQAAAPAANGGPDDFGYVWVDAPYTWIDATDGTDTGMSGDGWNQFVGPVSLPFAFKFYADIFDEIYISSSGSLAFRPGGEDWPDAISLLDPTLPNGIISPFSVPLVQLAPNGPGGQVYYRGGGAAPNRYFVVQWNEIMSGDDQYTFEVVLYENGDVLFQYGLFTFGPDGGYWCATRGIEDAEGLDGLAFPTCHHPQPESTVLFIRPQAAARARVTPRGQGSFASAGAGADFSLAVLNSGDLGADTYNITVSSAWPYDILMGDGTPLTDRNGDGVPDTGPLGQGQRTSLRVRVHAPAFADVLDNNSATVTVRSTRDPAFARDASLRTAVPLPYAQAYWEGGGPGAYLSTPGPDGGRTRKLTAEPSGDLTVAATPSGGYIYLWAEWWLDGTDRIRYALLDRNGSLQAPIGVLVNPDGSDLGGYQQSLAVAAAPNGSTGVAWRQNLSRAAGNEWERIENVYFALLGSDGSVQVAPTKLTNHTAWVQSRELRLDHVQIAAADDGRFLVAWNQYGPSSLRQWDNIYYTVRGAGGEEVKPVTRYSVDTVTHKEGASWPRLTALSGNRFLLAYAAFDTASFQKSIAAAVFDSLGNRTHGPLNPVGLPDPFAEFYPQAVTQLSGGSALLVWSDDQFGEGALHYAVLDGSSYMPTAGPHEIANPAAIRGGLGASVAADANNRAVIAWNDGGSYRPSLFYAVVDGGGALLTPATPSFAARTPTDGTSPYIVSNYNGYGAAPSLSYAPTSTTQPDMAVSAPRLSGGAPGGSARLVLRVSNQGLPTAQNIRVTAELDPALRYLGADPEPAASAAAAGQGETLTWTVNSLDYLGRGVILLDVGLPDVAVGTRYPVDIAVSAAGTDHDGANNTTRIEVMAAAQVFLPALLLGEE